MKLLGAIIAGGLSRRFGRDKAEALIDGVPLLERVAAGIGAQTDELIIVGRRSKAFASIEDYPTPLQGPLGGLCGALRHAEEHGFDAVLTAGCDVLPVPKQLALWLAPGPAIIEDQPLFGLWPTTTLDALLRYMGEGNRSLFGWADHVGARRVTSLEVLHNFNTPADLLLYCRMEGLVP